MITSEIIDAMVESGCTAEQLAAVVKASLAKQEEEIAKKREGARLRKQKQRERESQKSNDSHAMSRDVTVTKKQKEKRTKKEKIKNNIYIPPYIPPELWEQYKLHRVQKKSKLTPIAEQRALAKLERMKDQGQDPAKVIEQSLENGWVGLFDLKGDGNEGFGNSGKGGGGSGGKYTSEDARNEVLAKYGIEGGWEESVSDNVSGGAMLRESRHLRQDTEGIEDSDDDDGREIGSISFGGDQQCVQYMDGRQLEDTNLQRYQKYH